MAKSAKPRKATFALPHILLQQLATPADQERVSPVNSAARESVQKCVTELEREEFRQAMAEASCDPEFILDVRETEEAFRHSDAETIKEIPWW
jgi:hypothetical protein